VDVFSPAAIFRGRAARPQLPALCHKAGHDGILPTLAFLYLF
jgi:hypothetical protein